VNGSTSINTTWSIIASTGRYSGEWTSQSANVSLGRIVFTI
jgi:hypothetical protein